MTQEQQAKKRNPETVLAELADEIALTALTPQDGDRFLRLSLRTANAIRAERKRCLSLARCMAGKPLIDAIESGEELT